MRKYKPIITRAKFEKMIQPLGLTTDKGPAWQFKLSQSDRQVCVAKDKNGRVVAWGTTWRQCAARVAQRHQAQQDRLSRVYSADQEGQPGAQTQGQS